MDLTIEARVAQLVIPGGSPSSEEDIPLIRQLIGAVSAAAEAYMDRYAQVASRTEYFDVRPLQRIFLLKAFPVTTVTLCRYDPDQDFEESADLDSGDDYSSPVLDEWGCLHMKRDLNQLNERAIRALKVTYTGGMATDTQDFVTRYQDIALAIEHQVGYLYRRRNDLGAAAISSEQGSITIPEAGNWLRTVRETLDRHRRPSFAA